MWYLVLCQCAGLVTGNDGTAAQSLHTGQLFHEYMVGSHILGSDSQGRYHCHGQTWHNQTHTHTHTETNTNIYARIQHMQSQATWQHTGGAHNCSGAQETVGTASVLECKSCVLCCVPYL